MSENIAISSVSSILTESEHSTSESDVESIIDVELLRNNFYNLESDDVTCDEPKEVPKAVGFDEYFEQCQKKGLVPVMAMKHVLAGGTTLNLKASAIHPENLEVVVEQLLGPPPVPLSSLNLSGCDLSLKCCELLADLVERNFDLSELNLSFCKLTFDMVKSLADGFRSSQGLQILNFSHCNLDDQTGVLIAEALTTNESVKLVNFTCNCLGIKSSEALGSMLKDNKTLQEVILRWNYLYINEGCKFILNALRQSNLQKLDLSGNTLGGSEFLSALSRALKATTSLKVINLEMNDLHPEELQTLCSALKVTNVEEIYLGDNQLQFDETVQMNILKAVEKNQTMKVFSFGTWTSLPSSAADLAEKIMQRGGAKIIFRGRLLPNPRDPVDFAAIVIDRAKYLAMAPKKKKLRKDLGHFMLLLKEHPADLMTAKEFQEAVQKFKLKIDDNLIQHLMETFSKGSTGKKFSGQVSIKEMSDYYLDKYPTESPPLPVKKTKKGGKKGKK